MLDDINIGKSVGAKAKNYDVKLPSGEYTQLTEGTHISHVETIAGKGRNRQIDELPILLDRYGGDALEWQKKKGVGFVDYQGESYRANLHWYEEPKVGRVKFKVSPNSDGSWFYED